jgi:hypothetical protein
MATIKCAPSKNLNTGFPHFATAKELYAHLLEITAPVSKRFSSLQYGRYFCIIRQMFYFDLSYTLVVVVVVWHQALTHGHTVSLSRVSFQGGEFIVRNFVAVIEDLSPAASLVETELFPAGALEYYTKKNMGWEYTEEEYKQWQLAERGGAQGDYRDGMPKKIANVIDCLKTEPLSKRAVIPIPFSLDGSETVDWKDQGQNKCCRELHFYLEDGKLKVTGLVRMQNANIFVKNVSRPHSLLSGDSHLRQS